MEGFRDLPLDVEAVVRREVVIFGDAWEFVVFALTEKGAGNRGNLVLVTGRSIEIDGNDQEFLLPNGWDGKAASVVIKRRIDRREGAVFMGDGFHPQSAVIARFDSRGKPGLEFPKLIRDKTVPAAMARSQGEEGEHEERKTFHGGIIPRFGQKKKEDLPIREIFLAIIE